MGLLGSKDVDLNIRTADEIVKHAKDLQRYVRAWKQPSSKSKAYFELAQKEAAWLTNNVPKVLTDYWGVQ